MSNRVVWDGRWVGRHGIARHAHEVGRRLDGSYRILKPGRVLPTSAFDPLYLRRVLGLGRGDLFVTPGFNASLPGPYRQLLTVHDLIHLRIDEESSPAKRLYYSRIVLPAIFSARRVLTVSQFSRAELINWTGLSPDDVVVVGNGCSFAPATRAEIDRAIAVDEHRVLYVGNSKPHKNFSLLVGALQCLPMDVGVTTVGVSSEFVARTCEEKGISFSRFDVRQNMSESELRELYVTSSCVALPSTYEGFGLAALEGMAVGTATAYLCEAVAEVVGPLGFRSEGPTDSEGFGDALARAMETGKSLKYDLVTRAMNFSWDDCAQLVQKQVDVMLE